MKRLVLILLTVVLTTACNRSSSTPMPTGLPLNFPTPRPEDVPLCQPSDLKISSNSNITSDAISIGITLTNQSKKLCALANPPKVVPLTTGGKLIETQLQIASAIQTPPAPAILLLNASESKIISINWQNYCQNLPSDGITIRVNLSQGQDLDVNMDLKPDSGCKAGDKPSSLQITPYSDPP